MIGWEYIFRSQVLGDRESGTGLQVRVRVRVLNLDLVPEHLNLGPDGRDLGPENELATAMS